VFANAFAATPDVDAWIEGVRREGPLVSGNFFEVLGVEAAHGRRLTPSDDRPGRPPVLVLSHRSWSRQFNGDPGIVNRTIRVNGTSFQVVGVMPEDFRGLDVAAPDYWAPLALLPHFRPGVPDAAATAGVHVIGRLAPGVSQAQAIARLAVWDGQQTLPSRGAGDVAVPPLTLEPKQGRARLSMDTLALFMPLFFAFGLILLIGCANVANLLLARSVARQREIGIRLAIGASRQRIVGQLLLESLLPALVAAALAFALSRLLLHAAAYAVVTTLPPGMSNLRFTVPDADWRVALFLLAGACASTLFFALAPALQVTRVELVRAIRGEVVRDARPGRSRNALVVMQVTGAVLLLVCAAIFLRSSWAAATLDPGIRIDGIVTIDVLDETRRAAALDVVRTEPSVTAIAAASPGVLGGRPGTVEAASVRFATTYQFVSQGYFDLLGVALVSGRGFTGREQSADAGVAAVSASAAARLWPGRDPLGQTLRLEPRAVQRPGETGALAPVARRYTVVGVVRDIAGFRRGGARRAGAGVFLPVSPDAAGTSLIVATRGPSEAARQSLVNRMARIDPNLGDVETLRTYARIEAYLLAVPFWLTLLLGALALVLTLSGLFSVLSYLVEQRTKEFGVRMALGATRGDVVALVLSQVVRPVGAGLLLGGTLTAALAGALLATPAAAAIGDSVHLFDPIAYAGTLLCVVGACAASALVPAWRAGRVAPVAAMREG
jgi:predicted permease